MLGVNNPPAISRIIEVIETELTIGLGEDDSDPMRRVQVWYKTTGECIGYRDSWREEQDALTSAN